MFRLDFKKSHEIPFRSEAVIKASQYRHLHLNYLNEAAVSSYQFFHNIISLQKFVLFLRLVFYFSVSLLRKTFEEAQKDSKIKHWSYTIPSDKIDDPTGEIQRLKEKVTFAWPLPLRLHFCGELL